MSCLTATQSTSFVRALNAEHRRPLWCPPKSRRNRRPGTSRTHISPSCRINRVAAERDIRLKSGDIDFERGTMSAIRSIVYGVDRPVQDRIIYAKASANASDLADALTQWRKRCTYIRPEDWVFASKRYRGRRQYWGQAILRKYIRPPAQRVGIQKRFGWHTFRHTNHRD